MLASSLIRRAARTAGLAAGMATVLLAAAPAAGQPSLSLFSRTPQAGPASGITLAAGRLADADKQDIRAGIVLRLKPGWITYWRTPGDAGIPPRFDFSESENAAEVTVLWPAPRRIDKGGVMSIGYDRDVIFPLRVKPRDPARPVLLRLTADYGVCEKLCMPANGTAAVQIPVKSVESGFDFSLAMAERRVPRPQPATMTAATGGSDGILAIGPVRADPDGRPGAFLVDVTAPTGGEIDLFAEAPTPDWSPAMPKPVQTVGNRTVFSIVFDGGRKTVPLRLTASNGRQAVETTVRPEP